MVCWMNACKNKLHVFHIFISSTVYSTKTQQKCQKGHFNLKKSTDNFKLFL